MLTKTRITILQFISISGLVVFSFCSCATEYLAVDISSFDFSWSETDPYDFESWNSVTSIDPNEYLIFGNVPVSTAAPGTEPILESMLGRWEGYDEGWAVKNDIKIVFVIQEINNQYGHALLYSSNNLQYPQVIREVLFEVVNTNDGRIHWKAPFPEGYEGEVTLYKEDDNTLRGFFEFRGFGSSRLILTRNQSHTAYKDYEAYLESINISMVEYEDPELLKYGPGYMIYNPFSDSEIQSNPQSLMLFLHGAGDKGR
jgi:hypothetical protein